METDWSALLKAVFGSAYLTFDPLNYPDVVFTSRFRQQSDSYATCHCCRPCDRCRFSDRFSTTVHCAGEGVSPCDVTMASHDVTMTSSPVVAPSQSFTQLTHWNAVPSGCSKTSADSSESVENENCLPVYMTIIIFSSIRHRIGQKMAQNFYTPITLSNINRFLTFFHCLNQKKNL